MNKYDTAGHAPKEEAIEQQKDSACKQVELVINRKEPKESFRPSHIDGHKAGHDALCNHQPYAAGYQPLLCAYFPGNGYGHYVSNVILAGKVY